MSRALPQIFPAAVPIAMQSRIAAGLNRNSGATFMGNAFAHSSKRDNAAHEEIGRDIAASGRSAARVIHKINKHQSNKTLSRNYISSLTTAIAPILPENARVTPNKTRHVGKFQAFYDVIPFFI
jgi:hypothetical protein